MKKVFCVLIIFLLGISFLYGQKSQFRDLFKKEQVKSICVIVDDSVDCEGVFNGNKKIVNVNNFNNNLIKNCYGVTIKLHNDKFNLNEFFALNNIVLKNMYYVFNNIVYDCIFVKRTINSFNTIQIVVNASEIIIGIPMILNSF